MLVVVCFDGGDAKGGSVMDAYKRDDGMVVFEMTVEEAEGFARRMAAAIGASVEELQEVLDEVRQ